MRKLLWGIAASAAALFAMVPVIIVTFALVAASGSHR